MKTHLRLIAAVGMAAVLVLTSACSAKSTPAETSTENPTVTATQPLTEAPTEAPQPETEPEPETKPETEPPQAGENNAAKNKLVGQRWVLAQVIEDGVSTAPNIYYGSIIRQTGAYLQFNSDNTFSCSLGTVGCEGTFEPIPGAVAAHISVKYDVKSDGGIPVDEDTTMNWDIQSGTIEFDFNNVTNIFVIN